MGIARVNGGSACEKESIFPLFFESCKSFQKKGKAYRARCKLFVSSNEAPVIAMKKICFNINKPGIDFIATFNRPSLGATLSNLLLAETGTWITCPKTMFGRNNFGLFSTRLQLVAIVPKRLKTVYHSGFGGSANETAKHQYLRHRNW